MSYDNRNRGSIWKNDRKEKDTHPDLTGTYTDENGVEFFVNAWKRKPDANPNAPALNFVLKKKDQQPNSGGNAQNAYAAGMGQPAQMPSPVDVNRTY